MTARAVRRLFDEWAVAGRGDRMEAGHLPTAGQSLHALPWDAGRPQTFLDLGTGNGYAVRFARDRLHPDGRALGVDLARNMLTAARARTTGAGTRTAFLHASIDRLPLRDASVDLAFTHEVLYYAPDVDAVLADVRRVLTPGATFHASLDYYRENPDSHHWPDQLGLSLTLESEPGWARRFRDAGFEAVVARRLHAPLAIGASPDEDANTSPPGTLLITARNPGGAFS